MAKKDDIMEAIQHERDRRENRMYRYICITAAGTFLSIIYKLGGYIYDKWYAFKAAITLFIELVKRGGQ